MKQRPYTPQIYPTGRYPREPEPKTLTIRAQWAIVDNKHKLVFHKDGYNLLFYRRKDAERWLMTNKLEIPADWRVMKVETCITAA